jgi:hypothetical protein
MIDRNPPPPNSRIEVTAADSLTFSDEMSVKVQLIKKSYPAVPTTRRGRDKNGCAV